MAAPAPPVMPGTLQGMDVNTFEQAQQLRQQELLAQMERELAASQGQATQAGQAFQEQAAAPPPQLSAWGQLLPTLLGNVASIIGQQPAYREEAQEGLQTQKKELMLRRVQTLKALETRYESLADAARQLGNKQAEQKALMDRDKVQREHARLLKEQGEEAAERRQANQLEAQERIAAEANRTRLEAARISASGRRGGAADMSDEEIAPLAEAIASNQAKLSGTVTERARIMDYMKRNNMQVVPEAARKSITELEGAERAVEEIERLSAQINTAQPGLLNRGKQGLKTGVGALTQKNSAAAEFESVRGGLSGNLSRAIAAERGVLTDQDRRWAMMLIPTIWDTQEVATNKIARLRRFIQGNREGAVRNYSTAIVGGRVYKPSNPLEVGRKLAEAKNWKALDALIEENPELDDDPAINRIIENTRPAE